MIRYDEPICAHFSAEPLLIDQLSFDDVIDYIAGTVWGCLRLDYDAEDRVFVCRIAGWLAQGSGVGRSQHEAARRALHCYAYRDKNSGARVTDEDLREIGL